MELVNELLAKASLSETKRNKKITKWGDESDEEDGSLIGETSKSKDPEVDQDKKVFLDAFKSLK